MTYTELEQNKEYHLHHVAAARGYISRKVDGVVSEYHGRFGDGYVVRMPRRDTTQYYYIAYYVREKT